MRLLIVTQYFWPENFRVNDVAAELSKLGHDVSILTATRIIQIEKFSRK